VTAWIRASVLEGTEVKELRQGQASIAGGRFDLGLQGLNSARDYLPRVTNT
jgi:hypothetical protein